MNRVLALQSLPEAYFGFGDDVDSNISNICSSESIDFFAELHVLCHECRMYDRGAEGLVG